jgi:hypothetical protein
MTAKIHKFPGGEHVIIALCAKDVTSTNKHGVFYPDAIDNINLPTKMKLKLEVQKNRTEMAKRKKYLRSGLCYLSYSDSKQRILFIGQTQELPKYGRLSTRSPSTWVGWLGYITIPSQNCQKGTPR